MMIFERSLLEKNWRISMNENKKSTSIISIISINIINKYMRSSLSSIFEKSIFISIFHFNKFMIIFLKIWKYLLKFQSNNLRFFWKKKMNIYIYIYILHSINSS